MRLRGIALIGITMGRCEEIEALKALARLTSHLTTGVRLDIAVSRSCSCLVGLRDTNNKRHGPRLPFMV